MPIPAPTIDCPEALAIPRPASARAPLLLIPASAEPIPETPDTPDADGENEAPAPEPEIDEAELEACAEPVPVPWPAVWLGLFRDVPREPVAACAIDWPEAPDILRPASARASLLATPAVEALALETDGENEAPVPDPETDEAELEASAEPVLWPVDWLGLFREVPLEPVAAWAID